MEIRGLAKFSLIDYPGKIACILFTSGCNFRCPYCHNPHLVLDPESQPHISEKHIISFLKNRKGKLEGVVLSGGEPSLNTNLRGFAGKIKDLGYLIKLDTNGSNPDVIIDCHRKGLIDAIGVDYKSPAETYHVLTGCHIEKIFERVWKTIRYALENSIPTDVRTTVHKKYHSPEVLTQMRKELNELGVGKWTLQQFHPAEVIEEGLQDEPTYTDTDLIGLAKILGNHTRVRGLKGTFIFDS